MKRDPSLIPLSHQHHNGLALCVLAERSLAGDDSPDNLRRIAEKIVGRYELELKNHFELEEQLLFPACPEQLAELVAEFTAEHREIERLVDQLRDGATPDIVNSFTGLLRSHIRREESELFEKAQRLIARPVLDRLGLELEQKTVKVCLDP